MPNFRKIHALLLVMRGAKAKNKQNNRTKRVQR